MSRANTNWLFISLLVLALIALHRPSPPMHDAHVDHVVDLVGLGVALAGLALRIVSRHWKVSRGNGGLVTDGPYGLVRNPMYVGSLLAGLGVVLILGSLPLAAVYVLSFLVVHILVVRREEAELRQHFGQEYEEYLQRTPGWVPRLSSLAALAVQPVRMISCPVAALLRERTAVTGILLAAAISEVGADTMTEGWHAASREGAMWLPGMVALVVLWAVSKPLAKRLCAR